MKTEEENKDGLNLLSNHINLLPGQLIHSPATALVVKLEANLGLNLAADVGVREKIEIDLNLAADVGVREKIEIDLNLEADVNSQAKKLDLQPSKGAKRK
jgi:hypothetical protein